MTIPNADPATDNQPEKVIDSLKSEIASLKSQLEKKGERIANQDVILKQITESDSAGVRSLCRMSDSWGL